MNQWKLDLVVPGFEAGTEGWEPPVDLAARNRVVCRFARLVAKIAGQYSRYPYARKFWPFEDIFQDGIVALIRAIETYKPDGGAKFITYATVCLHNAYRLLLWKQGIISIGSDAAQRRAETPEQELDERFQALIRRAYRAMHPTTVPTDELHVPLNWPDEDAASHAEELEKLREAMSHMRTRDAEVIRERFGFNGEPDKTLAEIGAKQGVSRERIRQIEERALASLRNWLMETTEESPVARSKVFRTSRKVHPINGTAASVAPEPMKDEGQ